MNVTKRAKRNRQCLVVLAAHISTVVCTATVRSVSVFLVEWRRYFESSVAEVSAVSSFVAGSMLVAGLLSGPIITRLGCHNTVFLGAAIMICGTLASVFASSPMFLCLSFGVFGGFGMLLAYNSAQVAVARHFTKGYSRANGFVNAGAALGLMMFPPLFQIGIDQYGWRGMQLLLVGIQAQLMIVGVILRPRQRRTTNPSRDSLKPTATQKEDDVMVNTSALLPDITVANNNYVLGMASDIEFEEFNDQGNLNRNDVENEVVENARNPLEDHGLVNFNVNHCHVAAQNIDMRTLTNGTHHDEFNVNTCQVNGCNPSPNHMKSDEHIAIIESGSPLYVPVPEDLSTDSCIKDASTSTTTGQELLKEQTMFLENEIETECLKDMSCRSISRPHSTVESSGIPLQDISNQNQRGKTEDIMPNSNTESDIADKSCLKGLVKSSGWPLLKDNVGFRFINFCQFVQGVCYTVVMTHFVASVVFEGVDEQLASYLLSVLGITGLVSRLCNGWVIDRKLIGAEHLYFVPMALFGATTLMSRMISHYAWYVFMAALFGAFSGLFKCLRVVVVRKFAGVENMAPALGVTFVFSGAGDLLGPVFAGALYDASNTYDVPFYIAGVTLIISSLLYYVDRLVRRCREKRNPGNELQHVGG